MRKSDNYSAGSGQLLTIPEADALTGTISATDRVVTGVGTLFLSELLTKSGSGQILKPWLVVPTGEIVEIDQIVSNTRLLIRKAFTGAVVASTVKASGPFKGTARRIRLEGKSDVVEIAVVTFTLNQSTAANSGSVQNLPIIHENENGLPPMSFIPGEDCSAYVDYI